MNCMCSIQCCIPELLIYQLPEMKSVRPKTGEHPFVHLGLQNLGMITGGGIMLLIALFEDQIILT